MRNFFSYCLALYLLLAFTVKAQNNLFNVGFEGFGIYHKQDPQFITEKFGFYYERKISQYFSIGIDYSFWNKYYQTPIGHNYKFEIFEYSNHQLGGIQERINYKMLDFPIIIYKLPLIKNRHSLKLGAGLSYCWGLNRIVDSFFYYPYPPIPNATIFSDYRHAHYLGIVPQVSYDFLYFWKQKIDIGADIKVRYYIGIPWQEIDYGLHFGVSF